MSTTSDEIAFLAASSPLSAPSPVSVRTRIAIADLVFAEPEVESDASQFPDNSHLRGTRTNPRPAVNPDDAERARHVASHPSPGAHSWPVQPLAPYNHHETSSGLSPVITQLSPRLAEADREAVLGMYDYLQRYGGDGSRTREIAHTLLRMTGREINPTAKRPRDSWETIYTPVDLGLSWRQYLWLIIAAMDLQPPLSNAGTSKQPSSSLHTPTSSTSGPSNISPAAIPRSPTSSSIQIPRTPATSTSANLYSLASIPMHPRITFYLNRIALCLSPTLDEEQRFSALSLHAFILTCPTHHGHPMITRGTINNSSILRRSRFTDGTPVVRTSRGILLPRTGLVNRLHDKTDALTGVIDSPIRPQDICMLADQFLWFCVPGTQNPFAERRWRRPAGVVGSPRSPPVPASRR